MDVKFINPFLQGTLEVLKKMAFVEPRPGKAYLKEHNVAGGDVSGIIGITGDAVGSLAISFSESCICEIISRMLGESHTSADQDVFDAVGELTNMISGVARTHMERDGMSVYAAIPSVIYGKRHEINHILSSPSIVIPFSMEQGSFFVDVCIKKTAPEARQAEKYQVVNVVTPVAGNATAAAKAPVAVKTPPLDKAPESPVVRPEAATDPLETDQKGLLKNKLKEMIKARDEIVKILSEQPFMDIKKRQALKKRIPFLDNQIRRVKLDISAIEMMASISQSDIDNPKLAKHYQHYDDSKRRR
jgi:chemotaxis protein CheX